MAVRQRSLTVLRCASAVSREDRFLKRVSQPGDDGASTRVRRPLSSSPPGWRRDTLLLLPLLPLLLSYPRQRKSSLITRIDRSLFLFPSRPSPLSRQKGETFSTDNEPHFFSRREKFEPPLNRNTIARIREIATTPSFHRLRSARDNSRAFHTGAHSLSLSLPLSAKLQLSTSIRNVAPNEVDRPKSRLERGHALMEGSAGIGRSRGSTIAFFPAFLVFRANDRVLREESNGETLEKW